MNKKLIRLTESDLHRIVREAVNNIIKLPEIPDTSGIDFDTFKQAVLDSQGLNRAEKGQLISFYYKYEELLGVFYTEDGQYQMSPITFSDFMDAVEDYGGFYNEYGEYETEIVKLPVGWSWETLYSVTKHIINDIIGNNVNFEDYENTLF